jgi:hypothetical protein
MAGVQEEGGLTFQHHRYSAVVAPTPPHSSSGTCDGQIRRFSPNLALPSEVSTVSGNTGGQSDVTKHPYAAFNLAADFESPVLIQDSNIHSTKDLAPIRYETEIHTHNSLARVADAEDSVISLQKVNWEHHGPWSWVSVCSQPGLRWVCERTATDEFCEIANGLTKSWSQRLKLNRNQTAKSRGPELDKMTAWKYVTGKVVS